MDFGNDNYLFVAWSPNCEPVKEVANSEDAPGRLVLDPTRAVLILVWPSILLQSAHDRVATAAETVTASRLWSVMSVKQRK